MEIMTNSQMIDAIQARHSVRQFLDRSIDADAQTTLTEAVQTFNEQTGLDFQLLLDEPLAFGQSRLAKYGSFKNANNYIACLGPSDDELLDQKIGYFGEYLVLLAQHLGLNTCWVGLMYNKRVNKIRLVPHEKLVCVIALGYGETQGKPRKTKPIEKLMDCEKGLVIPEWFECGMMAAQLAPTAVNHQKFRIRLEADDAVSAVSLRGSYAKLDLGIVRLHFETGAKSVYEGWHWTDWN